MENYKEKMKRKVNESKLRHELKNPKNEGIGNAVMAIMSIVGCICTTIALAFIVYKCLI
mgnify:CR=1 FL=1